MNNYLDFFIKDNDGCEYIYACAQIESTTIIPIILNSYQTVVFLGTEYDYKNLISVISDLKSIKNIENYLIQSGMVIVEEYDTVDIGSTLWFISKKEKIESLIKQL